MAKSHVVKVKLIGNYSAKFGAIFVTSERIVLRLCKIKRLNSNSFVLRLRYLQILFPPGSPYSSSLYCAVFHYWDLWFLRRASKSRVTALCSAFVKGRICFTNHILYFCLLIKIFVEHQDALASQHITAQNSTCAHICIYVCTSRA